MRRISIFGFTLLLRVTAGFGQPTSPDSPITQSLLVEIRQLRQDLQSTAATIQRVHILMYRVQIESSLLSRVTERRDNARNRSNDVQERRKMVAVQIEQAQTMLRNSQSSSDQKATEQTLQYLKSAAEMSAREEQESQIELVEAESQFRAQQAKMNGLQDLLDNLDRNLEAYTRR